MRRVLEIRVVLEEAELDNLLEEVANEVVLDGLREDGFTVLSVETKVTA